MKYSELTESPFKISTLTYLLFESYIIENRPINNKALLTYHTKLDLRFNKPAGSHSTSVVWVFKL